MFTAFAGVVFFGFLTMAMSMPIAPLPNTPVPAIVPTIDGALVPEKPAEGLVDGN